MSAASGLGLLIRCITGVLGERHHDPWQKLQDDETDLRWNNKMKFIPVSKNTSTVLRTRMRDLRHCVATVTICLLTKATHLRSIHFVKSVVLPVRTHQHHNNRAVLRASYKAVSRSS